MKKLLLVIITTIFALALCAQNKYATTTDGRKVLLKSDGTWEYVKTDNIAINNLHSKENKSTTSNTNSLRNNNTSSSRVNSSSSSKKSTGRTYIRGPRGGCYYINSSGNKTYVDRSLCN